MIYFHYYVLVEFGMGNWKEEISLWLECSVHLCTTNQNHLFCSSSKQTNKQKQGNVPLAIVTAFHRKEGIHHACERLLLQTEKVPELKTAVQYRVSLLKHNNTLGAITTQTEEAQHVWLNPYLFLLSCLLHFCILQILPWISVHLFQ